MFECLAELEKIIPTELELINLLSGEIETETYPALRLIEGGKNNRNVLKK